MRAVFLSLWLLLIGPLTPNVAAAQETHVYLLPTIHRFHQSNPRYSYEHLQTLIANYNPGIIALEIRPEDMDKDTNYLKKFYPPEIIMVRDLFPGTRKAGIDDYGPEMRGKLLHADVFKDTSLELGRYKLEERKMNADSFIQQLRTKEGIPAIISQHVELLKTSSAEELVDGRYDELTDSLDQKLQRVLASSPYAFYHQFNKDRDIKITANIEKLIKENPGKRIVVLIGANHHNRAKKMVLKMPGVVLD
ncbi:hypothetical protein [Aridibaculum aurantiacum]|uniref:hypothetical protein n=1 Tax=Aridibaculum aurantiacum TaxID=2810307 RepID=UPI001A97C185|nr:hypothetical protein [Aridibaculum aurantiacum]